MERRRSVSLLFVVALLGNAFALPFDARLTRALSDNELESNENGAQNIKDLTPAASEKRPTRDDSENVADSDAEASKMKYDTSTNKVEFATPVFDSDEDDDDFDEPVNPSPPGGSNIFSLLRLANALFPSSGGSSSGANALIKNIIRTYFKIQVNPRSIALHHTGISRRSDISSNLIDVDEIVGLNPPPQQRQEISEENDDDSEDNSEDDSSESKENDAAESVEKSDEKTNSNDNEKEKPEPQSNGKASDAEDDDDDDFSDEPEGDGQGGGILGLLAGLSGGEDGQSDLGSLLAAVSGIVANLSGDGFDLNALIASGLGLFVGLLSEGEENPGAVIASYLLTSLDTITGGGSKNNGAFFGTFLSKLIKGTSAAIDPEASSEEDGKEPMKDSAGFFKSFLMALLGEMSKGSSTSSSSHPSAGWTGEE